MSSTTALLALLVMVAVCSANIATGRASLRPSAGKRSFADGAILLTRRSPARYYRLAPQPQPKQYDSELSCNLNTMSILNSRYEQLREQLEEIAELMEACQTLRSAF
uniref:Uncharacterized protein n=1 Tax=Caenorhabditis japonica TaxID=281687 RepID=A0A8R1DS53_CAEJA